MVSTQLEGYMCFRSAIADLGNLRAVIEENGNNTVTLVRTFSSDLHHPVRLDPQGLKPPTFLSRCPRLAERMA